MEQLINVLVLEISEVYTFAQNVPWTDRPIPWAGIAAVLAGTGSLLSGLAAYRLATRRNNEPKPKNGNGDN